MTTKTVPLIISCARCGLDHNDVVFLEFKFPVKDDNDKTLFTHWALCPTNGEPIHLIDA